MSSTATTNGAHDAFHARTRNRGVNPLVYWLARAVLQPFFHLYFRMSRIGREHIPESGPVIFCANHRSFLDPFVIGTCARRPLYYVAKQELFRYRIAAWFLNSLGAFPVVRGAGDQDMLATAKAILDRGDAVLVFAEGTRIRPGALGRPKRGVGRLALETGAPVVPVAVIGTENVRKGWRIRPHKVRIRVGSPLTFPKVEQASPQLAAAVTDRIWPNVMLQWEWLGGLPPLRRAAVIGAGGAPRSPRCSPAPAWRSTSARSATRSAPADAARARVNVLRSAELELSRHDLVCFATPPAALPAAVAEHGARVPRRAGVLVLSRGLVPPLGTLPAAYVAERTESWAVGVLGGPADRPRARGRRLAAGRRRRRRVPPPGHRRADRRRLRRRGDARRGRRGARRLRRRRRRARGRGRRARRVERGRQRRRQGLRRGRGVRAHRRRRARDVRRPGRYGRPRRRRARRRPPPTREARCRCSPTA